MTDQTPKSLFVGAERIFLDGLGNLVSSFVALPRDELPFTCQIEDAEPRWRILRLDESYIMDPASIAQSKAVPGLTTALAVPVYVYGRFEFPTHQAQVEFMLRHGEHVADINGWCELDIPHDEIADEFADV